MAVSLEFRPVIVVGEVETASSMLICIEFCVVAGPTKTVAPLSDLDAMLLLLRATYEGVD